MHRSSGERPLSATIRSSTETVRSAPIRRSTWIACAGEDRVARHFQKNTVWIDDLRTGGRMLFPGFGVRPQSLRGTEGFGVLCVRLAPSQPDADGPADALTGA